VGFIVGMIWISLTCGIETVTKNVWTIRIVDQTSTILQQSCRIELCKRLAEFPCNILWLYKHAQSLLLCWSAAIWLVQYIFTIQSAEICVIHPKTIWSSPIIISCRDSPHQTAKHIFPSRVWHEYCVHLWPSASRPGEQWSKNVCHCSLLVG